MANTAQAKKRVRQSEKRRRHNTSRRSMLRTYIKRVIQALKAYRAAEASTAYQALLPILDRMVNKGIIHKNKAARHKSRLSARLSQLETSVPA